MTTIVQTLRTRIGESTVPPWAKRPVAVLHLLGRDMLRVDVLQRAGGMAYTMLFSIVPSLAATFAIISAFQPLADPKAQWFDKFRDFVLSNLAPDTGWQVVSYLEGFLANLDTARIGLTGMAGLLVTLILLLYNIEGALNDIWQQRRSRSLFRRFIFFWTFCTLGAFMLTLVLGILSRFDLTNLMPGLGADVGGGFGSALTTAGATFLFFAFLYKIGPNTRVRFGPAAIGAAVATVLIRLASSVFAVYAASNQFYGNVYGAVAALPFFLLWLYVGWVVTLVGGIVAWRVQTGFGDLLPDGPSVPVAKTPLDLERELQTRSLMPFLCLLAVGRAFVANQRQGISARAISAKLGLPVAWVSEGLAAAAQMGYVVMAAEKTTASGIEGEGEGVLAPYYLTTAPAALPVSEVLGRLTDKTWGQIGWLRDLLVRALRPETAGLTLADLLPAGPEASAPSPQPRSGSPARSGASSRT